MKAKELWPRKRDSRIEKAGGLKEKKFITFDGY